MLLAAGMREGVSSDGSDDTELAGSFCSSEYTTPPLPTAINTANTIAEMNDGMPGRFLLPIWLPSHRV